MSGCPSDWPQRDRPALRWPLTGPAYGRERIWLWLMRQPGWAAERRDGYPEPKWADRWQGRPHVWLAVQRAGETWNPWTGPTIEDAATELLRIRGLGLDEQGHEVPL